MSILRSILMDLGVSDDSIKEQARLRKDLELDSTETVQVALELKRRLGVAVKFESRKDLTLSEVCRMIERAATPQVVKA